MWPENYIQPLLIFPTLISVVQHWFPSVANTRIMENEANGLTESFEARNTTDRTLRLELISRNQNGLRHDQDTGVGAEVRNIEYSIALKIKRGELILPVWDYVADRLGEGGRCKSNSPKLKLRSQLLFTATWKLELRGQMIQKIWSQRLSQKLIPCMAKDTLENYKIKSRKSLLFPSCDCPLEVLCDIFTKKIFLVFI